MAASAAIIASIESDGDPAPEAWPTFEDIEDRFLSAIPWKEPATYDFPGFFRAAVEAWELDNGLTLLAVSQPLHFDSSLAVRYAGEAVSKDGCPFFGFFFKGGSFDVLIWIDDDACRARLIYRGDGEAYLRAELLLRMFAGETLAHLR